MTAGSPNLSPNIPRRGLAAAGPRELSPRFPRKLPEFVDGSGAVVKKSPVPPPVPPKPSKTLTSPEFARRVQNMPKSPVMPRKVYHFQEQQQQASKESSGAWPALGERDHDPFDRGRRENQMPPRSPSRSPEVRHRAMRKTPSSSPSPRLGRKLMPQEDRAPPPAPLTQSHPAKIQFCQQEKGIPVKRCIVAAHPSTAVVLAASVSRDSLESSNGEIGPPGTAADPSRRQETEENISRDTQAKSGKSKDCRGAKTTPYTKDKQSKDSQTTGKTTGAAAVSEATIKENTESAVFGSVSPKLKRQKKISIADDGHRQGSLDSQRTDSSFESSTRSPPYSPQTQRGGPNTSVKTIKHKDSMPSGVCTSSDTTPDRSPGTKRAQFCVQQSSGGSKDDGTISADIAGGITYHTHLPSDGTLGDTCDPTSEGNEHEISEGQPVYAKIYKEKESGPYKKPTPPMHRKFMEGSTVYHYDPGAERTMHVSSKTVRLIPAKQTPGREGDIPHCALTAGATVSGRNAAGRMEHAGGEPISPDSASPRVRARGGRESERPYAGAESVPTPPPPSLPGESSSSGLLGRNLGERIREAIHESSFREVFTAELSSSSFERDDGTFASDDDSVFAHSTHSHERDSARHRHFPAGNFRREEECSVDRYLSDSSCASPQIKRAKTAPKEYSSGPELGADRTAVAAQQAVCHSESDRDGPFLGRQENSAGFPQNTTAIRRIDVDVNVTLPQAQYRGEAISNSATLSASHTVTGSEGSKLSQHVATAGQAPEMMATSLDIDPNYPHSSSADHSGDIRQETGKTSTVEVQRAKGAQQKTTGKRETPRQQQHHRHAAMETDASQAVTVLAKEDKNVSEERGKGDNSAAVLSGVLPPPSSSPSPSSSSCSSLRTVVAAPLKKKELATHGGERTNAKKGEAGSSFMTEGQQTCPGSRKVAADVQRTGSTDNNINTQSAASVQATQPPAANVSPKSPHNKCTEVAAETKPIHAENEKSKHSFEPEPLSQKSSECQESQPPPEHVPPPSPTAMDMLAEEEEEEEEDDVDGLLTAHHYSDISFGISQEMKLFGENVVRRLSNLLDSQQSESDSCLEEAKTDLLKSIAKASKPAAVEVETESPQAAGEQETVSPPPRVHEEPPAVTSEGIVVSSSVAVEKGPVDSSGDKDSKAEIRQEDASCQPQPSIGEADNKNSKYAAHETASSQPKPSKEEIIPVLHEELNTFSTADLPGERLVTSDTTETLSTDHETSASSKRESTTSTATDETLTSFKTRSTTDSAEFDEAFVLAESLVFVRSKDEKDAEGAVVEAGRIVKRPTIPTELKSKPSPGASGDSPPQKPRKKRRRQAASYDVGAKTDVTEPVPKRGSKQITEVIDAYCDETSSSISIKSSDDSDISSSTDDVIREGPVKKTIFGKTEHPPPKPSSNTARKRKPPADRSTDSSDENSEDMACRRRSSSTSQGSSSFRIPEIEETFGELMGVKTFLEDMEDKTLTADKPLPVFVGPEDVKPKEFWSASHYRRSRTSPAKTDRTESDLDISEQRDDASTDSMYADDEDEGAELLFQRSYSEEQGGEVLLSCTIYNSSHDKDGDSDEFWADAETGEAAAAAEAKYKEFEASADAAGSAFQNARHQMQDIHQHLQDLRRQMEFLQDDITSTSLTMTPDFSLESEQRPLTE